MGLIKNQTYYIFILLSGKGTGIVIVFNKELNRDIPLVLGGVSMRKIQFSDIGIFKLAFAKGETRTPFTLK